MFKTIFYTLALIFVLNGAADAGPLKNFTGVTYIDQTAKFYNNLIRNQSDLPIGNMIITHLMRNGEAHPAKVLIRNKEKGIMLMINKSSTLDSLGDERCMTFTVRLSEKSLMSQFDSYLCIDTHASNVFLKIKGIHYK